MKKFVISCDDNNIGSKKIIESNGGILKSNTKMGKGEPNKLIYWIKIK